MFQSNDTVWRDWFFARLGWPLRAVRGSTTGLSFDALSSHRPTICAASRETMPQPFWRSKSSGVIENRQQARFGEQLRQGIAEFFARGQVRIKERRHETPTVIRHRLLAALPNRPRLRRVPVRAAPISGSGF